MTPSQPLNTECQPGGAVDDRRCPFCGGPGKLISTMGEWVGVGNGPRGGAYGPERRRIVCSALYETPSRACPEGRICDTEVEAWAAWNTRAPTITPPVEGREDIERAAYKRGWSDREADILERADAMGLPTPPVEGWREAVAKLRKIAAEAKSLAADLNAKPDGAKFVDPGIMRMAYAMGAKCDHFLEAATIVEAALALPAPAVQPEGWPDARAVIDIWANYHGIQVSPHHRNCLVTDLNLALASPDVQRQEEGEGRDAARYRYLRDRDAGPDGAPPPSGLFIGRVPENLILTGEDADRAIDLALPAAPGARG